MCIRDRKGKYRQRKLFRYPAKFFNEPLPINFRGEEYYAPSPINEFLSFVYGDDWAIPKMTNNKEEYLNKKHFNTNQIIVLIQ